MIPISILCEISFNWQEMPILHAHPHDDNNDSDPTKNFHTHDLEPEVSIIAATSVSLYLSYLSTKKVGEMLTKLIK